MPPIQRRGAGGGFQPMPPQFGQVQEVAGGEVSVHGVGFVQIGKTRRPICAQWIELGFGGDVRVRVKRSTVFGWKKYDRFVPVHHGMKIVGQIKMQPTAGARASQPDEDVGVTFNEFGQRHGHSKLIGGAQGVEVVTLSKVGCGGSVHSGIVVGGSGVGVGGVGVGVGGTVVYGRMA